VRHTNFVRTSHLTTLKGGLISQGGLETKGGLICQIIRYLEFRDMPLSITACPPMEQHYSHARDPRDFLRYCTVLLLCLENPVSEPGKRRANRRAGSDEAYGRWASVHGTDVRFSWTGSGLDLGLFAFQGFVYYGEEDQGFLPRVVHRRYSTSTGVVYRGVKG
jgi:hypothetical protein